MTTIKFDDTYFGCFGEEKRKCECVGICTHHTCTSSSKRTRSALIKKGYSTHFEVEKNGNILRYRDEQYMCQHCGSSNAKLISIDVTHLDGAEFPEIQIQALKELVEYLCSKWNIPQVVHEQLSGIYPHRALGSTRCPGNLPMERLNAE